MLLQTHNLKKVYGHQPAVNGIDLTIETGSFTAILGPNGAGKSTTMALLTGNLRPTNGQIKLAAGTKVGLVFQASVLDTALTVIENLQVRARLYHQITAGQVAKLCQQLGLTAFEHQRYGTLSGGQRRRVDIARALLNDPDILFLDEPTTGLDIQTRTAIWTLLHQLQQVRQLTIVLTTHYLDEADSADNIYIVDHGQVVAQGTAAEIKQRAATDRLTIVTSDVTKFCQANLPPIISQQANVFQFQVATPQVALALLSAQQALITSFEFRLGTMDEAFMTLTGKAVR